MKDFVSVAREQAHRRQRTWSQEVELALSMLDCSLNGHKALYVSSELTTGRRFYDLLEQYGVATHEELRNSLGAEGWQRRLWDPNAAAANTLADTLRRTRPEDLVVTPAPFLAPDWTQAEYLGLWDHLIRTRVKAVYFNDGWHYSNGCTYELTVALDAGVPIYDAEGRPLDAEDALGLVQRARRKLVARGFDPEGLRESRDRLRQMLEAA